MKTEISHGVWQFSRSKNRHSVLFYFYRYALLTFVGFMVVVLLIEVISDGWEALIGLFYDRFMRAFFLYACQTSLCALLHPALISNR